LVRSSPAFLALGGALKVACKNEIRALINGRNQPT
jgi:hypothetical protein